MRIVGIVLCLVAFGITGYSALKYKAPGIEADIEARATQALSALAEANDDVDMRVDGRHITLEGRVVDEEQRQLVLLAAAAVSGALGPIDKLEQMTVASPYHFSAIKDEEGGVTIQGLAPTPALKAEIEADALAIFGDDAQIDVHVAAGEPEGDWRAAVGSALDALATLRQGELAIEDSTVALEGDVVDMADVEAIDFFAGSTPSGFTWTHDVGVYLERVEPFTFSVVKDEAGSLSLSGFAPDEHVRTALIEQGEAVGGDRPVFTDIQIAGGMPDEDWPALVQAGISAMKDMEAGRFDVVGNDVSFSSDPAPLGNEQASLEMAKPSSDTTDAPDLATDAPLLEIEDSLPTTDVAPSATDAATEEIVIGSIDAATSPEAEPTAVPTPTLTIDKVEQGAWTMRGVVPDQRAVDALVAAVRDHADIDDVEAELELVGGGPEDDWLRFAADHVRALNEVRAGRLSLEDFEAHLIGVVETPDAIEPVEKVLAAIDPDMAVDLQPIDPRPTAVLDLKLTPDDGVVLNGALPGGMTEGEALLALGIRHYAGKLEENGRGPAGTWEEQLSTIGALLPAFEEIDLSFGGERPKVKGRIHAHGDADLVARELVLAFGDERQPLIDVETTAVMYKEGAIRTNPLNGRDEFHSKGYWLPFADIVADEAACRERSAVMLATEKITFRRGEEVLDNRDQTVLNDLAGLAIACLETSELVLEIGGHTDSRGARRMNQELSQARADAVLAALTVRGVDAKALIAIGHGDTQPVADNATDEGRAANRRITFEWKAVDELQASDGEG